MRRVQFIEFHDQPSFPSSIRDEVTDALQFGLNLSKTYAPIAPILQRALNSTETRSIVDLCSGAGGPWFDLSRKLHGYGEPLRILLTDKYPNFGASQNVRGDSDHAVAYFPSPVDARHVPRELQGFRTMFTSFHHFPPAEAQAILQDAVDARQSIGIFEITRRSWFTTCLMLVWVLMLIILTPRIRPFRSSRFLWTYLVPIIPFVLFFDGVMSCLRTYSPRELKEIVAKLPANDYQWEAGEHRGPVPHMPITYLIGHPPPPVK